MATISTKIYKHHKKSDGTYNVKVCIFHKGQRKYINTNHYLVRKQLTSKFKIKDRFIADLVERQLIDYRRTVSELGNKLSSFSSEALRDYLRDKDADIDFIAFCDEHVRKTKLEGREGTAHNHNRIKNNLIVGIIPKVATCFSAKWPLFSVQNDHCFRLKVVTRLILSGFKAYLKPT